MTLTQISKSDAATTGRGEPRPSLKARIKAAAAVAAKHADRIDAEALFPTEAFEAIRGYGLLSLLVPVELGGESASMSEVADVCFALGRACASTGMIYAMHQTKLACIARHGLESDWHRQFLRQVAEQQLLLASSTTEGQGGGNVRSSAAAVKHQGQTISLERAATCISYGLEADGLVTTARRADNAADSDQVLVVFHQRDYTLEKLQGWNTMGMRGTCSSGFMVRAKGVAAQILPEPYEKIHLQTMVPTAHMLWGSVWAGVAACSVERARQFLRNAARQSEGKLPPGAAHFTNASAGLKALRGLIGGALRRFEGSDPTDAALPSLEFQTAMTLLKVEASERAVEIALTALRACGLSGYRNDGAFSVSRNLRDALSSPIMINNDRILANLGSASLLEEAPASLFD